MLLLVFVAGLVAGSGLTFLFLNTVMPR